MALKILSSQGFVSVRTGYKFELVENELTHRPTRSVAVLQLLFNKGIFDPARLNCSKRNVDRLIP